jgi:hypothetical protein
MSAIETSEGRAQDVVRPVATVTTLPSRATPDLAPLPIPTLAQIAAVVTPPDIWSDDRPSLRKMWLYARYGRWTDASGPFRVLGQIDAFVLVLPVHAVAYAGLWIWERPARRYTALAVALLIKLAL